MGWTLGMPQGRVKIGQSIRVTDGVLEADLHYQRGEDGKARWVDDRGRRLKWQPTHWQPARQWGSLSAGSELL